MKFTLKLTKLLKKEVSPESIVKFIYLHVFELLKESKDRSVKNMNILHELSETYNEYYDLNIKKNYENWTKTIFPSYINVFNDFYSGIVGRLTFFSVDIEKEVSDVRSGVYSKDTVQSNFDIMPDTYYWYGNPINWSECYEIKLNENKNLVIRKCQLLLSESRYEIGKQKIEDQKKTDYYYEEDGEIILLPKTDISYNYIDNYIPYNYLDHLAEFRHPFSPSYPISCHYMSYKPKKFLENLIQRSIESYKSNVSKKNGYDESIQQLWDEYNKLNNLNQLEKVVGKRKNYLDYKPLVSKEINELQSKFLIEYNEKINKLKQEKNNE